MRLSLQIVTGIAATTVVLAVLLWRPVLAFGAIGWAYLTTSHSYLIWMGIIGAILLLAVAGGVLFKLRRK